MGTNMHSPPHPGEVLKGIYLDELGITITQAAGALGVSRQNLSEIVNGHTGVSPKMALRLAKAFGTSPEMWLDMQKNHDLWQASKGANKWLKTVKRLV